MRFALYRVILIVFVLCGVSNAQINPASNIAWPVNCHTAADMVYSIEGNTCIIVPSFLTNSVLNLSQSGLNLEPSSSNTVGLSVTPVNSSSDVEKFEVTGNYSGAYGGSAAGSILGTSSVTTPDGLAVDSLGNVWVAQINGSNVVIKLSPSGSIIGTYSTGVNSNYVAIDKLGQVWVTGHGSTSTSVAILNSSGSLINTCTSVGGFNPLEIAVDPNNVVWVVLNVSGKVAAITSNSCTQLPGSPFTTGTGAVGVAVSPITKNIWVTNSGSNTISVLSPSGGLLYTIPVATPEHIAFEPNGDAWVTQWDPIYGPTTSTIVKVTANYLVMTPISVPNYPTDVEVDGSGNAWVTSKISSSITEVSVDGAQQQTFSSGNNSTASVIDAYGNIWISNYLGNTVTKMSTGSQGVTVPAVLGFPSFGCPESNGSITCSGTVTTAGLIASAATLGTITPTSSAAATASLANLGATLAPFGTIYNSGTSSWSSLANFISDGVTPTISGGNFVFTGGVGGYTQSLNYAYNTDLPQWTITATQIVGSITSTSYGLGFGLRGVATNSTYAEGVEAGVSLASGTLGQVSIALFGSSGPGMAGAAYSTSNLSISTGDTIQTTITRNYDMITVSASDLTTKSAVVSVSYQWSLNDLYTFSSPNIGEFAIYNTGGTQTLTSFSVASSTPVGLDLLTVGDSKTEGESAGYWINSYTALLQQAGLRVSYDAGGAEETADVLNRTSEICSLKPKAIILNIGRNDIAFGVPYATYSANYASIVSQLQSCGVTVYHLLPLYESSGLVQTPLTNFIQSTYPSANIINANLQQYSGTSSYILDTDGVHPNPQGHIFIAQAILAFLRNSQNVIQFTPKQGAQSTFGVDTNNQFPTGNYSFPGDVAFGGAPTADSDIYSYGSIETSPQAGFNSNLYYSGGWKYSGNGTGFTIFENGTTSIDIWVAPNNTGGHGAAATPVSRFSIDTSTGSVSIGGGSNIVYRCTTAGTLPVGAMTITAGNCGASVDSGLRIE
jgi:DNA-binding beta-propeller fold protein YncE/lysophospholipase L1-like esterase